MTTRRRTLLISIPAVMALIMLAGCATTPAPTTIADTAARTPQLSTLNKLLGDAGLTETLRGAGPFTVFAPSDEAFKAVPAKTMAELAADKELLKSVLTYHVVPGKVMAADVKTGNVKSVQGANLGIAKSGTFVTIEDAVVTQSDVGTTNGVVHIIDKVLIPPKR
ncbi:MAG: fasciclin domain-containing protein [Chitinophagaceae bacterium]|nr:fasciclin domain-containing protein [Rubrivivax sp.]